MPYLGNVPAENYAQVSYQDLTGGSGTNFTLDYPVGSAGEIEVFVNNVRQEPTVAYTVNGTALTMTGSVAATDDFYIVFQGKAEKSGTIPEKQTDGTYVFPDDVTVSGNITSTGIDDNATSTAMTLDSSGNVLVGKSSASTSVAGIGLFDGGLGTFTRASAQPLDLNRQTDDGDIILFRKDGTSVGSIGVKSEDLYIGEGDTGLKFDAEFEAIVPFNTSTLANRDGEIDLGYSTPRFKDLYLSGGVYLGGTGSANKLDDVETGSWSPSVSNGSFQNVLDAHYIKTGKQVTVWLYAQSISDTTTTTNFEINNLPFTSSTDVDSVTGTVMLRYLNRSSSEQTNLISYMAQNGTTLRIYAVINNANYEVVRNSDFTNGNIGLRITLTYITT